MSYRQFQISTQIYDLTHLDPFTVSVMVYGTRVEVDVMFSFHLFTDQKGKGPRFEHHIEERYFCVDRHVYQVRGQAREQYFCTDMGHGDIIWTRITRRAEQNRAHVWVASAYNRDWQGQVLPHGHGLFRVVKVLAAKLGIHRP